MTFRFVLIKTETFVMNNFKSLGRKLSKEEQKKISGGFDNPDCGTANTYCGSGSGVTCCKGLTCQDAGNGQNPNIPGGDKLCA